MDPNHRGSSKTIGGAVFVGLASADALVALATRSAEETQSIVIIVRREFQPRYGCVPILYFQASNYCDSPVLSPNGGTRPANIGG